MAAIRNKNCLNVYRREEHKKPSLVSINNFQLPKAQRLKNMVTAHSYACFIFWYFYLNMTLIVSRGTGLDNWSWIYSSGIFRSYVDDTVITIKSFCCNTVLLSFGKLCNDTRMVNFFSLQIFVMSSSQKLWQQWNFERNIQRIWLLRYIVIILAIINYTF